MNGSLSIICQALDEANAWGRLEKSDFNNLLKRLEREHTVNESITTYCYIVDKLQETGLEKWICTEAKITEEGWGAPEIVFNVVEVEKFQPVANFFNHTMTMLTKYEGCDIRSHQKSLVTEMTTRVPFPSKADIIDYLSVTLSTSIKRLCFQHAISFAKNVTSQRKGQEKLKHLEQHRQYSCFSLQTLVFSWSNWKMGT